ncbi:MAG: thymidine phosphorylase [Microthrixaceae bacterium]
MSDLTMLSVIGTKRDGGTLSAEQIRWFIDGYTAGSIADEQASALLMAIVWRGLDHDELTTWTRAMIDSGDRMDLSGLSRPSVDKHSTGGVGDKISLPLCPLLAACGAAVPQMGGRGLGHTGGTIDKLESIPGWSSQLNPQDYIAQLDDIGAVICAAGERLAPADQRLYALRDVTGTVESVPLIASSIVSKKVAEGTSALVLDVKFGSGAFMAERDDARILARTMVGLGASNGVRTAALLTDMSTPLGFTAGNALEVTESIEVLEGGGPPDVVELTIALAEVMCELAGVDADPARVLASGEAMDIWRRMIRSQGGDPDAPLPTATTIEEVRATDTGSVSRLDARSVGEAAWVLGAGRAAKEHPVSPSSGVRWRVRPGDRVRAGEVIAELHTDDPFRLDAARTVFERGFALGEPPDPTPLVAERIG